MNNKVFQHSLHRELWQWLSDNPECDKDDWGLWEFNGGTLDAGITDCFACEYTKERYLVCENCPVIWSNVRCENNGSEYDQWKSTENIEERTRLALVIRDLPVRDGVICK